MRSNDEFRYVICVICRPTIHKYQVNFGVFAILIGNLEQLLVGQQHSITLIEINPKHSASIQMLNGVQFANNDHTKWLNDTIQKQKQSTPCSAYFHPIHSFNRFVSFVDLFNSIQFNSFINRMWHYVSIAKFANQSLPI